jgi:acetyltransferase
MDAQKLLKPKSMAVIGASEKDGFGGDTCRTILQYKKDLSRIYFVNPKHSEVFGRRCYYSVSKIEDEIDLAIICTPKKTVNALLHEAVGKGCKGAVVYASGYAETDNDGKADQDDLVKLCNELNIALMGPNCAGFANYIDDVFSFSFLTDYRERKGNIGLVSQSGQICLAGLDLPNMGFSYIISSGNSAQITVEEYVSFLVDDEDTKLVCAYIEGIKKPVIFINALRRAALKRKPVVILKGGRSERASKLAASHTGSLAGSDKAFGAILEKYGAIRVDDVQELFSTAQMFARLKKLPKSFKYASLNVSGGEALITADTAQLNGIELAEFGTETKHKLRGLLPSYATVTNPLDMTATLAYDPDRLATALEVIMDDEDVGAVILGYTINHTITDTTVKCLIDGLEKAVTKDNDKPIVWLTFVFHTPDKEQADRLEAINIPVLPPAQYGMKVLSSLSKFISYRTEEKNLDFIKSTAVGNRKCVALTEYESLQELSNFGIASPKQMVVPDKVMLDKTLEELSFPIVMKIDSPDILHKSDAGGVKLNIKSKDDAKAAFDEIMSSVKQYLPDARVGGVLIREMLAQGTELIIGITVDSQFGAFVMVGLGGVFVELFEDMALYPAPLTKQEALKMIESLKAYRLLGGFRGEPPKDIDALADCIVYAGDYACAHINTLKEMDINPLFVYEQGMGVMAADALIIKEI